MKKFFALLSLLVATAIGLQAHANLADIQRQRGDVNNDGMVDVTDANELINIILGSTTDYEINRYIDLNDDGLVDVSDLNLLVNVILGNEIPDTGDDYTFTVNGVSFTMVPVEAGTFTMGATDEQYYYADDAEYPTHQVTLSAYCIGQTEVTQELWLAVMGTNPSNFTGDLQRPVECVTWDNCQLFIAQLNALTGKSFRLPTEAEWEYAARGGNLSQGYIFAGSDDIGEAGWYNANCSSTTHPVAAKTPNELGIYDMSGNVWEWCQDWYGDYSSAAQTNPTGPTSGTYRVGRGGSWRGSALYCRVSNRDGNLPTGSSSILGLRLAL